MGFDFITTLSDEAIDPVRDVPAAMRDCVLISTSFYVLIAISMCGMGLGKSVGFNPDTAIGDQFKIAGLDNMSFAIYMCGFLGITACCFTCLMGFIRLIQAFANEGLLPTVFSEVNERTGIPVKGSWILTGLMMPLAFFGTLEQLTKLSSLSSLLIFSFVSVCSLHVRFDRNIDVFTDTTYRSSEPDLIVHKVV